MLLKIYRRYVRITIIIIVIIVIIASYHQIFLDSNEFPSFR